MFYDFEGNKLEYQLRTGTVDGTRPDWNSKDRAHCEETRLEFKDRAHGEETRFISEVLLMPNGGWVVLHGNWNFFALIFVDIATFSFVLK